MDHSVTAIVLAIAATASLTDVAMRRIPNALTFGAAFAALVYAGVTAGPDGVAAAAAGWVAGVLLFIPFFLLGGMGAGDVKLLAAIGAWLGLPGVLWAAIYTAIAGGAVAIVVALARGYLRTALSNIGLMLRYWSVVGPRPVAGFTLESNAGVRLPYAVPILIGTVLTLWLR